MTKSFKDTARTLRSVSPATKLHYKVSFVSVLRMMWPGIATYTSGTLLMIVTIISYPVISGCRTLPRDVTNTFTLFLYYTPKLLRKGVELGLRSAGIYVL